MRFNNYFSSNAEYDDYDYDYENEDNDLSEFKENYYSYFVANNTEENENKKQQSKINKPKNINKTKIEKQVKPKEQKQKYVGVKPSKKIIEKYKIALVTVVYSLAILIFYIYGSSIVNAKFSNIQSLRKDLLLVQKENAQLKVAIEKSLNYTEIEQLATNELGLSKYTAKQTKIFQLPKNDYVEFGYESKIKDEESFLSRVVRHILN